MKKNINISNEISFKTGIIGAGNVGISLAEKLFEKGALDWIVTKSEEKKGILINIFKKNNSLKIPGIVNDIKDLCSFPEIIILSVNDRNIKKTAVTLADCHGNKLSRSLIFHCSGIYVSNVLISCKKTGAKIASAHPYQTFYYSSKYLLNGIGWGLESKTNYKLLEDFVKLTDGNFFWLPGNLKKEKAVYHASAVSASNFVTSSIELAIKLAKKAEIDYTLLLPPIIKTTVENNIVNLPIGKMPLTGPIIRGDLKTIKNHIKALNESNSLILSYCSHSLATLEMAFMNNTISEVQYKKIKKFLLSHLK